MSSALGTTLEGRRRIYEQLLAFQPAEIQEIVRRLLALPGLESTPLLGEITRRPNVFFPFVAFQMQLNGLQVEAGQLPRSESVEELTQDFSDLRGLLQVYLTAAGLMEDVTLSYLTVRPAEDNRGQRPVTLDMAYDRSVLNPLSPQSIARDALGIAAELRANSNGPPPITGIAVIHLFRTAFPRPSLPTLLENLNRSRQPLEHGMMADGFGIFVHIFMYFTDLPNPGGIIGSLADNEADSAAFLYALLDMYTGVHLTLGNPADQQRYERYVGGVRSFVHILMNGLGPVLAQFTRARLRLTDEDIQTAVEYNYELVADWADNLPADVSAILNEHRDTLFNMIDEIQRMTRIHRGDAVTEAATTTHVDVERLVGAHDMFGTNVAAAAPAAEAEARTPAEQAFRGFVPPAHLVDGTETGPECQLCANPLGPPPRQEPRRVLRCCHAVVGEVCFAAALETGRRRCPFCRRRYGEDGEWYGESFGEDQDGPPGPNADGAASQGGASASGAQRGGGTGPVQPGAGQGLSRGRGDRGGAGGCADDEGAVNSLSRFGHSNRLRRFPATGTGTIAVENPRGPPVEANDWFVDVVIPQAVFQYVEKSKSQSIGEEWEGRTYHIANHAVPGPIAFEVEALRLWLITSVRPLWLQEVNRLTATV